MLRRILPKTLKGGLTHVSGDIPTPSTIYVKQRGTRAIANLVCKCRDVSVPLLAEYIQEQGG